MGAGLLGAAKGLSMIPGAPVKGMVVLMTFVVLGITGVFGRNIYRDRWRREVRDGSDIAIKTLNELGRQQAKDKQPPIGRGRLQ